MRRMAPCLAGLLFGATPPSEAQAFTPKKGLFSLTTLYQLVENTGHRMSDGFMLRDGQSTSMGALVEGEYGLSDRLAVSLSLPYIMARYHGVGPTQPRRAMVASRQRRVAKDPWRSAFRHTEPRRPGVQPTSFAR